MEFEDEVLREMCFIAPDNPADTDIGQAVLVSAVNAFSIDFGSIVLTPAYDAFIDTTRGNLKSQTNFGYDVLYVNLCDPTDRWITANRSKRGNERSRCAINLRNGRLGTASSLETSTYRG